MIDNSENDVKATKKQKKKRPKRKKRMKRKEIIIKTVIVNKTWVHLEL